MREWHRRSGRTELDCTVMFNFLYIHKQTHTYAHTIKWPMAGVITCGHLTAPFARPGVYTRVLYRAGNRVRGTRRSELGRGQDRRRERGRG